MLSEKIAVVFVFDSEILKVLSPHDRRLTFIYDSLLELDVKLRERGSQLIVRYGNPVQEIPTVVKALKIKALFFNRDYEPYAKARDRAVTDFLERESVEVFRSKIM